MIKKIIIINIFILFLSGFHISAGTMTADGNNVMIGQIKKHIKQNDAVLVSDETGKEIISINPDKMLVPASILKVMTSLVVLKYLGEDFRFLTEFYMDENANLTIKGYGDPLLISEVVEKISATLKSKIKTDHINHIFLDNSYFKEPIVIPGVTNHSPDPYNSPVGALCVNFNTVFFSRGKDGTYVSAEKQTPLLPYALNIIKKSGLEKGRIMLSQEQSLFYAGNLFAYYLKKQGINFKGDIKKELLKKDNSRLVFSYLSGFSLKDLIQKLFLYSNNFIANQLYIACGAKTSGAPGTLEKGNFSARQYIKKELNLKNIFFLEGSGISRKNRVSARSMIFLLEKFKQHHSLLRIKNNEYFKTGTLQDISTRAGYIKTSSGKLYSFVIMLNTNNRPLYYDMNKIRKYIKKLN